MLRSFHMGLAGLLFLAAGCAANHDDTGTDEAAVGASIGTTACSDVVPSDDGKWAIYARCANGEGGKIIRLDTTRGYELIAGTYASTDTIVKIGANARFIYWVAKHADDTRDVFIAEVKDAPGVVSVATPVRFPLGEVHEPFDVFHVSPFGQLVVVGPRSASDWDNRALLAASVRPGFAPLTTQFAFGEFHYASLWPSPTGQSFMLFDDRRWRILTLEPHGASLGPMVRSAANLYEPLENTFDGASFVARHRLSNNDFAVSLINAQDGSVAKTLSSGFSKAGSIFARGGYVWQTAQRGGDSQWILERMRRNGEVPSFLIATDPSGLEARPSRDGSSILFRGGDPFSGPTYTGQTTLGIAPADASATARTIISSTDNLEIDFTTVVGHAPRSAGANRQLLRVRNITTREKTLRLIDEVGGATLATWRAGVDYANYTDVMLSADGSSVYVRRACNTFGEGPRGEMIAQLWPTTAQLTGCTIDGFGEQVEIPQSAALLLVDTAYRQGEHRSMLLVRP